MVEEDDGQFFTDEFLKLKIDIFAGLGVKSFAPVLQQFVRPGMIEAGNVGLLGGVPERILVGVGGDFLTDDESGKVGGELGDNLDLGGHP